MKKVFSVILKKGNDMEYLKFISTNMADVCKYIASEYPEWELEEVSDRGAINKDLTEMQPMAMYDNNEAYDLDNQ